MMKSNIVFYTKDKSFSSNELIKRAKMEHEIRGNSVKDIKNLDIEFNIFENKLTATINGQTKDKFDIPMK